MVGYALASPRATGLQIVSRNRRGIAAVGRFGLAYRVAFAPNSLVYSAVSPVFYGIASRGTRVTVGRFAAALVEALFVVLVVPYVAFAVEASALTDAVLAESGAAPVHTLRRSPGRRCCSRRHVGSIGRSIPSGGNTLPFCSKPRLPSWQSLWWPAWRG
jgi:hypothetical protein